MQELVIPNPSKHDVASFDLVINGSSMNASYQVKSIIVTCEVNRIPQLKVLIRDGDASARKFEISNSNDLIPGNKVVLKLGFDGKNKQVFAGIITKQSLHVQGNGNTELTVECKDESVRLTVGRKNKYFNNLADHEVIEEIVKTYNGLTHNISPTKFVHKELVQHQLTDWDFINLRAEACGQLVIVEDGKLKTVVPDTSAKPALQVSYGSSVLEMEVELDAKQQYKQVQASSWDASKQDLVDAGSDEASAYKQAGNLSGKQLADTMSPEKLQLHHSGLVTEQELQQWSNGVMLRSRMAKIRGRVRITGFSDIRPGDMVKLDGVSDRFDGNLFVSAIQHTLSGGAWFTDIQFGLDPTSYTSRYPDLEEAAAAGLVGGINGLHIGKVVHLATDPDGEHRIQVKIPTIDNKAKGIWSRVACLDAGNNRGTYFRPELNDEVIVGFINNDPNDAVVLGMLHSSARKAPIQADDNNHEKGIFTRSNMRIHFNDNTKTLSIDTPAGNKIILDEKESKVELIDQNKNKIVMDKQGISLSSPKNIVIEAGANLTLTAAASLSIGGNAMDVKADGNLKLSGAMAGLSATGITEIKGSLIKIN